MGCWISDGPGNTPTPFFSLIRKQVWAMGEHEHEGRRVLRQNFSLSVLIGDSVEEVLLLVQDVAQGATRGGGASWTRSNTRACCDAPTAVPTISSHLKSFSFLGYKCFLLQSLLHNWHGRKAALLYLVGEWPSLTVLAFNPLVRWNRFVAGVLWSFFYWCYFPKKQCSLLRSFFDILDDFVVLCVLGSEVGTACWWIWFQRQV